MKMHVWPRLGLLAVVLLASLPDGMASEFRKVAIKQVEDQGGDAYHLTLEENAGFQSTGLVLLTDGTHKIAALKAKKPIEPGDQSIDTVLLKQYPDYKLISTTQSFYGYFQIESASTTQNRNSPTEPAEITNTIQRSGRSRGNEDPSTFSFILEGGFSWSSATVAVTTHSTAGDTSASATGDSTMGITFGFLGEKILNPQRSFALESGLRYGKRGNSASGLTYLNLPVYANYLVGGFTFGAGLNFGYMMSAPASVSPDSLNKIDIGVLAQANYAIPISSSADFVVGLQYLKTLTSALKSTVATADVSETFSCVDLLFGFQFGFGPRPAGFNTKSSFGPGAHFR